MLNLNNVFLDFNNEITLTKEYKDKITKGRDALRKKVGDNFVEKNRKRPKHCMQGSYTMNVAIMPLEGEDFDLDNGVYLQGYGNDKSSWPSTATVHSWITDAVKGHTSKEPIDKNTCVRIIYVDSYHIDLPIYILGTDEKENNIAYLAHKSKGWIESDPKAFTDWFQGVVNDNGQVVRHLVKYLKAWKEYKGIDIPGMAVSILVCNHLSITEEREDISLLDTITNIIDELNDSFACYKPVTPTDEDLFSSCSETRKYSVINGLTILKNKIHKAIYEEKNEKKATEILQGVFGDRFPEGEDKDKSVFDRTSSPVQLGGEDIHFA